MSERTYNKQNHMAPKNIDLPIKKLTHEEPKPGVRDTPLDHGGSSTPKMSTK